MHDLNDTIYAIATPMGGLRTILRITGPKAQEVCRNLVEEASWPNTRRVFKVDLCIDPGLMMEGLFYLFPSPHSYTGQDLVEIHLEAGLPVLETLIQRLLTAGVRQAGPGEFTARAYLNGKIDLAQAEAVNEVISATNHIQCRAAEQLLQGRPAASLPALQSQLLEALSLLEAGLDFAEEDVPGTSPQQTTETLKAIRRQLEVVLSQAFDTDTLAHLPSVGLAGTPNAGKSTLFNALIGRSRSIVSDRPKTTRDVLESVLELRHSRCVLFDCAGLLPRTEALLDQLAQQAAVQSLRRADLVVFCVDVSKPDWQEDLAILGQCANRPSLYVGTKADLPHRLNELDGAFGQAFLPVSAKNGMNLNTLREAVQSRLTSDLSPKGAPDSGQAYVMLTARLRQAVTEAIDHLDQAIEAMGSDRDEIAAMTVRAAYQALSDTEHHVDDKVLETIFSSFCIGK